MKYISGTIRPLLETGYYMRQELLLLLRIAMLFATVKCSYLGTIKKLHIQEVKYLEVCDSSKILQPFAYVCMYIFTYMYNGNISKCKRTNTVKILQMFIVLIFSLFVCLTFSYFILIVQSWHLRGIKICFACSFSQKFDDPGTPRAQSQFILLPQLDTVRASALIPPVINALPAQEAFCPSSGFLAFSRI